MFQNGISRNTKCAERDGFRREGHNYDYKVISYSSIMNAMGMYVLCNKIIY